MYLKSLTLRGFKSFADSTRLDFEPGITVIVGPNGSGKSNIVDALTWSMGTRSPKDLRGGQMADVIFAGAGTRRAMGRAAVEITIDNSDQSLPIEFSEVTVGRAMFATGENAYSINDVECRQLDVAELLSDTGLGRETHTIVGQGRIDAVLNARPEERRAFIEEAAGILKHRRRKERALRKLSQMESHLERLVDLLSEMRRQLRPLERQAEAAAKHHELTEQLRQVRTDRGLRDLSALLERWRDEQSSRADSQRRLTELESSLAATRQDEQKVAHGLSELTPAVRSATETQFALANLMERASGLADRIVERRNGLAEAVEEPIAGRDPEQLRGEAQRDRGHLAEVAEQVTTTSGALERSRGATRHAEQARRAHEQAAAAEARRRIEARERQIRFEGEVAALRSSLAQASAEDGRLASQLHAQADRAEELESDVSAVQSEIQRMDAAAPDLADHLSQLAQRRAKAQKVADAAVTRERELDRRRASLEARADALFAASAEPGEGAAVLAQAGQQGKVDGVMGPLAALVQVQPGHALAVSAALGPLADALVVANRSAAEAALGFVADREAGRALLLVASAPHVEPTEQPSMSAIGAEPLAASVEGDPGVRAAVRRALAGVYVCEDLSVAYGLADSRPDLVFVTRGGEMAGARGHAGGGVTAYTAVLSRAAADVAREEARQVTLDLSMAHRQVGDADRALKAIRAEQDTAQARMQESDALITSAAERLGRMHKELGRCHAERDQVQRQHDQLSAQTTSRLGTLERLEARGPEPYVPDPRFSGEAGGDVEAEQLDDALAEAREAEVQARLAHSTAEQEAGELRRRIASLDQEAVRVEGQLAERDRRQRARLAAMSRCDVLESVARTALARAATSRAAAAAERDQLEESRAEQQRRLGVARAQLADLGDQLTALRDTRHREDLVHQELTLQVGAVNARLAEIGIDDGEAALAARDGDLLAGGPERDAELAEAEDGLVRKIGLLGTVNPLALEEFQALQERHAFMTGQLDDLRNSKKDLMRVVDAVDARIREVFADAYADVARHFEVIFPKLFPGGTGRLVLTDPDDMLTTGVEVEARPPGKKVKRLSLLSGGERSLTALAVLFAIFAARPSPFYVLDEVEAALDDVNLGRFLGLLRESRGFSQWIIVTHQRRTMEIADTIYGVSMASAGLSKVVSRRLEESGLSRVTAE